MKAIALSIIIFAFSVSINAQDERRGFIGLTMGPSFPIGAFSGQTPDFSGAGPAANGYRHSLINFGYVFRKTIGVSASVTYGEYNMPGSGGDDWWKLTGILAGPMLSYPLSEKFLLDIKPSIGIFLSDCIIDSYGTLYSQGSGFGIDLRTGVRYNLFKRWCFLGEAGYSFTSQKFLEWHQQIQALGINVGIAYRLK